MCIICGRGHSTDDHTCSVTSCRAPKGRRCMHDSVKCGNCTSQGWENTRHTAVSSSCRWRKEAISGLVSKRFKRSKENARRVFKGVIIPRHQPHQILPLIEGEKDVKDKIFIQNTDGDLNIEDNKIIKNTPTPSPY